MHPTMTFRSAVEAIDMLIILRIKRDCMRRLFREIEADQIRTDWNTKGELLVELAERGVDYNKMIELIMSGMSFHTYPFSVVDLR